jgi:hypothetical protein
MRRLEALSDSGVAAAASLEARLRRRRRRYVSFGIGLAASALLGGIALAILEFAKTPEPAASFMRGSDVRPATRRGLGALALHGRTDAAHVVFPVACGRRGGLA